MPAFKLKLPSTFVLALVEEMLNPLNSLYFSTQLSLKILAKQSKTAKKMLAFDCWIIQLGESKDFPESASVFQWCNVYVPRQVRRIHSSFKAR